MENNSVIPDHEIQGMNSAQNLVNLKINEALCTFFFACLCFGVFFLSLQSIFFLPSTSLLLTQKYWRKVALFSGNEIQSVVRFC